MNSPRSSHLRHLGIIALLAAATSAGMSPAAENENSPAPAPATDRVGFPESYQTKFEVLRVVTRKDEKKVVTIYGNRPAASVTNASQLPYPFGSVIVMESASAALGPDGKPVTDEKGNFRKDKVTGLHVMRREKGFGEAYGKNRSGEWEFVEYRADGSYITPPQKSADCAKCHIKAGPEKDFVYQARLGGAK